MKPFILVDFIAFCRNRPADESYDPGDSNQCALAQFGFPGVASFGVEQGIIPAAVYGQIFSTRTRAATFGALADRLEQLT